MVSPYIGDPTTFAEGLGNNLTKKPQFCMSRNFRSDDVIETSIGSGIEVLENTVPGASFVKKAIEDVFNVDIVKETSKWARGGIKKLAEKAGAWFSGLWGQTGVTPTEFKLAGMLVSMKEQEVDTLQELSAAHPGPGELIAWADSVLGMDITFEKGKFTDSPFMRGEIKHPGPLPKYVSRRKRLQQSKDDDSKLVLHGTEHRHHNVAELIESESTSARRMDDEPPSPASSYVSLHSNRRQQLSKK